jgi:hypothetical protein
MLFLHDSLQLKQIFVLGINLKPCLDSELADLVIAFDMRLLK